MKTWLLVFLVFIPSSEALGSSSYFKKSYGDSRQEFLAFNADWTKGLVKTPSSFKVPSAKDGDLTVDTLFLGRPTNKSLLILVSGVHGAESFAGSAIQHFFLQERAQKFNEKNVSVLLVHALNPFGFKYGRRVTENNIDLNRNFHNPQSPIQPNTAFANLRKILEPQGPVNSVRRSFLGLSSGLIWELLFSGLGRSGINNAVAGGQFEFPKAVFYGGSNKEPQTLWLENLTRESLQNYKKVILLDLHTGLGDHGVLHLISQHGSPDIEKILGIQFATFIKNRPEIKLTSSSDQGFYRTQGDLLDGLLAHKNPEQEMLALTMEFGTLSSDLVAQLKSLNRMILENQGHFHGFANTKIESQVKNDFAELFNPSDDQWRSLVIDRADSFFTQLLSALSSVSK